jgi:hypothetical protein
LLDGIYSEQAGIPSVMISTEAFVEQCKTMKAAHHLNDYTFVEVFHPIATSSSEALNKEADRIYENVAKLLVNEG